MADYITLLGAEDIRTAGHAMQEAATSIRASVAELDDVFTRYIRELRELLVEARAEGA